MTAEIDINVADVHRLPDFSSERVTQGLFNEKAEVIEEEEKFCKVRLADGYTGWVAKQFLSRRCVSDRQGACFLVDVNLVPAYEKPAQTGRVLTWLPYGCRLCGEQAHGFLRIQSDRYGVLFVPASDLIPAKDADMVLPVREHDFVGEVEKFLGAPYLWGGRSFFGLDCSGFAQIIMRRFGAELPRDTKNQIERGKEIGREEISCGDLLFFPSHVALAVSHDTFIHSSQANGGVGYNSFARQSRLYSQPLDASFVTARRILC